jgi:integrase
MSKKISRSAPRRQRITKRLVDIMRPGEFISDSELVGFQVRRQRRDAPVFSLRYRINGRRDFYRIGAHGEVTAEEARRIATRKLGEVANDRNPAEERRTARAAELNTVDVVLDQFLERYAYNRDRPLRSADQYRNAFRLHVRPHIGALSIYRLMEDRAVLTSMLDLIEDNAGGPMADRALAYLRKAFNWQQARDSRFRNPIVPGMARTRPLERARTRILNDEELRDLFAALPIAIIPDCFRRMIRVLLYTTARRGEVADMRWEELAGNTWTIPAARSKIKLPVELPLTHQALELLGPRRKSGPVFTTDGLTSFAGFSKAKAALDRAIAELRHTDGRPPMEKWTIHDLRRSGRTLLSRSGVIADVSERCLGHLPPTIRRVYDQHSFHAEKLRAFEKLAALLDRIERPLDGAAIAFPTRR